MAVPKKAAERIAKSVPKFQKVLQIAKDRDVNESDTVSIINDMLADIFGYDKYIEVTSEFAIRGTYCDLAIKLDGKVQFLIEVKAIGIDLKENHMKQACDYGANQGIQWVILTNGVEWRVYRIRFEQPINYDLVAVLNMLEVNPRHSQDQDILFMISKEGLQKKVRDEFFEKVQCVNRFVIGHLLLSDAVLAILKRELKKLSEGMKIEPSEIEQIIRKEVLKREIVEGDEATEAQSRVNKFYRKSSSPKAAKKKAQPAEPVPPLPAPAGESVADRLLRESELS